MKSFALWIGNQIYDVHTENGEEEEFWNFSLVCGFCWSFEQYIYCSFLWMRRLRVTKLVIFSERYKRMSPWCKSIFYHSYCSCIYHWTSIDGKILLDLRARLTPNLLEVETKQKKAIEGFYVDKYLHNDKWLINCSYKPHKNKIGNHLRSRSKKLEINSSSYNNFIILGNFDIEVEEQQILNTKIFQIWIFHKQYWRSNSRTNFKIWKPPEHYCYSKQIQMWRCCLISIK